MRKLRRLRDWLLPELIYLDPMVASAVGQALVENRASHASVRRLGLVPEVPSPRRAPAQLMLATATNFDVRPGSGLVRL